MERLVRGLLATLLLVVLVVVVVVVVAVRKCGRGSAGKRRMFQRVVGEEAARYKMVTVKGVVGGASEGKVSREATGGTWYMPVVSKSVRCSVRVTTFDAAGAVLDTYTGGYTKSYAKVMRYDPLGVVRVQCVGCALRAPTDYDLSESPPVRKLVVESCGRPHPRVSFEVMGAHYPDRATAERVMNGGRTNSEVRVRNAAVGLVAVPLALAAASVAAPVVLTEAMILGASASAPALIAGGTAVAVLLSAAQAAGAAGVALGAYYVGMPRGPSDWSDTDYMAVGSLKER